jgi:hypothetical protein
MPTVPRYQRQVAPQPRPSGALRAVETETSAGVGAAQARAYVGRGAEQLGGAIADVGSKFLNLSYSARAKEQQEAKEYADQLAILGASNKLSTWERSLYADGGALTLQGEAAFGLPEKVNADFEKVAGEIEYGLTNPEQQLAFAKLRSQRGQSIALDVERHVSSEIKQFAVQELQAKKANTSDTAILKGGAGDFTRAGEEMDAYAAAVHAIAPKLGLGPEKIEAEIRDYRSKVHVGIIQQLVADENVDLATRYYEVVTGRTIDGAPVGYGLRADKTVKGEGFFGALTRPGGGVSSEISIGVEMDGKEVEIPTMVPTLTKDEVQQLLALDPSKDEIPEPIIDKAVAYARTRIKAGKSPFAGTGEQTAQYPELPRAAAQRSQIEGDQLDDVTKLLKQGNAKKQAQELRDQVQAEGGTLEEQRQRVKARATGDVEDMALDYIEHDHAVTERMKDEAREATSKGLYDILERTNGNLRSIQSLPAWKDTPGPQRESLRAYAKRLAGGEEMVTNWKAYYGARDLALDDPQAFGRLDLYALYRGKLANAQFEQLLDIKSAIRSKEATAVQKVLGGVSTDTQIWNSVIKAPGSGIEEDTDAARQVRTRWEQTVEAEQQARGKELDVTEKRQMLDDLVMDAAITKGSGWAIIHPYQYDFWDQTKKGYQITMDDIPQSERQAIVEGLRAAKPPLPATEANILRAYLQNKRKK